MTFWIMKVDIKWCLIDVTLIKAFIHHLQFFLHHMPHPRCGNQHTQGDGNSTRCQMFQCPTTSLDFRYFSSYHWIVCH
jgi:hypothetical protein